MICSDETDKKLSLELEIDYDDIEEGKTTREILLKSFHLYPDKEDGVLSAYCYLMEEDKDFYISRIARCIDQDYDEEVEDIFSFLEDEYENSARGQVEAIWTNYADEMSILVYVGSINGMHQKNTKELIAQWGSGRYDVLHLGRSAEKEPGEGVRNAIIDNLGTITPISKMQFAMALERISKQSWQNKSELVCYVGEIFGFPTKDGTKEELEIISYIEKILFTKDEQGI